MVNRFLLFKWLCGLALIFALSMRLASAWIRYYAPADELVQRSDSIVVGHIEGPIQSVNVAAPDWTKTPLFEYRTTLVITGVISGNAQQGKTPLLIHYGMKPVILKAKPTIQDTFDPQAVDANSDPKLPVGIYDSATTLEGGPPSDDIRQDHIWFLRTGGRSIGPVKEDTDAPGIWSPDDVQALDQKDYFVAVLTGDPDALTKFSSKEEWKEQQIRRTQIRLKVEKIAKIPDTSGRCDQLVAIFISGGPFGPGGPLALDELTKCGPAGVAKLVPLFEDSKNRTLDRRTILTAWHNAGYKEADAIILKWLEQEDQWWATLSPADQIWAVEVGQRGGEPYNDPRAVSFRNVSCAVEALDVHAAGAIPLIEKIRDRWRPIDPKVEQNNLATLCDQVLSASH